MLAGTGIVVVLAAAGLYAVVRQVAPSLLPGGSSYCEARVTGAVVSLEPGQAAIASTIAGVAQRRSMPDRAVTVAYAAALQESKLANLHYGDRDSVGIFQQRPSEGWGPARQLEDPVYATTRFFAVLAGVPGYRTLPVYEAAQAVQHSADGYAYQQYASMAADLASAYTGRVPHAAWCWYSGRRRGTRALAATRELTRVFGALPVRAATDPAVAVRVRTTAAGWAVACWLVAHASSYGLAQVRYSGYRWTFGQAARGWTRDRDARLPAAARVVLATG